MTLRPETHETAPWMVFSATPFRRYSTSGCQFGMARAKFTGRFSLKGTGMDYRQGRGAGSRNFVLTKLTPEPTVPLGRIRKCPVIYSFQSDSEEIRMLEPNALKVTML